MPLKPLSLTTRAYDRVVATTCSNMCEAACGMLIYVKDNRVVDIWGDPDNPINKGALCPKGSAAFQTALPHAERGAARTYLPRSPWHRAQLLLPRQSPRSPYKPPPGLS